MKLQMTNSPFNEAQAEMLNRLLPELNEHQRIWLSGYLAAYSDVQSIQSVQSVHPVEERVQEATVLFGSQTGNSQGLAKKLASRLKDQGFQVTLTSMNEFKTNTLKKVRQLFIVVSTQGEGDAPDNALSFYEFLHSKRAPKLDGLAFSVLALGDTSYEFFCKIGQDFDRRLEELGGVRLVPRVDCDVEFDEPAANWMNQVLSAVQGDNKLSPVSREEAGAASTAETASFFSRTRPFQAEVLENLNLNGRGSAKETRHLELSLADSGLSYEPGDSLGLYPENDPALVDEVIAAYGWDAAEIVPFGTSGESGTLRDALVRYYEITVLTAKVMEHMASLSGNEGLVGLLSSGREQELRAYIQIHDLLDLARDFSLTGLSSTAVIQGLRRIPPRLYSISSSQKSSPDEVHITVGAVRYEAGGRMRSGVCSTQLAERVAAGDTLPVFIQENSNFKLPSDPDAPIIMIGPGTGIAPFRSFLSEREETGAAGRNWLFFGDQHFYTDFLYQTEWQRWLKEGLLTRMDVAFSRDTARKVYVQDRMLEQSTEFYKWLQEGAYLYVCGDANKMARDVHRTLLTILEKEGGLSEEAAAGYLADLQQKKRYQRDVY